jgi:citrate synthase
MGKRKEKISSDIAWSTSDKISVRGLDLPNEILGHMNLGDLAFLQLTGRKATPEESRVFNAIVITLVEHGITPSEYIELIQKIQTVAEEKSGKMLPINATGAIGAICCEFGFPWKIVRGFGVMARAIGLVGHILEESENPISYELWQRAEQEILETSGPGAK